MALKSTTPCRLMALQCFVVLWRNMQPIKPEIPEHVHYITHKTYCFTSHLKLSENE